MSSYPPLDKSEIRIQRMFAAIAPYYDTLNHSLSLNVDRWWRKRTVELAPPRLDGGPILDVCTGSGDLALAYHAAARGRLPVYGADFCGPLLEQAVRKSLAANRRRGQQPLCYLQADTQRLPFADGQFQIVSVAFGLRNVTDTDRGLAEMTRVVRPGGRVVILEFSRPTVPVLKQLYGWYFRRVLPWIGQQVSRSPDDAYHYLPASVLQFPDGQALADRLRQHGLTSVRFWPLTLGIATVYVGVKP